MAGPCDQAFRKVPDIVNNSCTGNSGSPQSQFARPLFTEAIPPRPEDEGGFYDKEFQDAREGWDRDR